MKSIEDIYAELKTDCQNKMGLAINDTGDMAIRLRAFAAQIFSLLVQQDYLYRQVFPQTASGENLDRHAELRGLERRQAVKAAGVIRFLLSEADSKNITIPAGMSCTTDAGEEFITTQSGTIAAGDLFCDVSAEAKTAGAAGNVPAGSITEMMLAPAGVAACNNPQDFYGGTDAETDSALRARTIASYRTLPNGANAAYYENAALTIDGVAGVSVMPKNRGAGTVDVVISAADGTPSQELIGEVSDRLNADREICVDILVSAPTAEPITVTLSVLPEDGYTFAEIKPKVIEAITDFFNGSLLGKSVYMARLYSLVLAVEGVKNLKFTSPTADVAIGAAVLPKLSSLTITEMEA